MNRVLAFWIALLLVFGGGMMIWTVMKPDRNADRLGTLQVKDETESAQDSRPKLEEFELIDQAGNRVNSREFAGQVWAGSFFFSSCPSTCYNQNIKLQQLHAKFADRGLRLVSITCDPGKDTAPVLASYASRFNANARDWKFLTPADGDMQYITHIANDFFGVAVGPETHTDRVVLFDREGNVLGAYSVLKPDQLRELERQIDVALSVSPTAAGQTHAEDAATSFEPLTEEAAVQGTSS